MRIGRLIALIGGIILAALIAGVVALAAYSPVAPEPDLMVTPSESGEGRNITLTLDESVKLKSN